MRKILKTISYLFLVILFVGCESSKQEPAINTDKSQQILIDKESGGKIDFSSASEAIEAEEKTIIESPYAKTKAKVDDDPDRPAWIGTGNIQANVENQIGAVSLKAVGRLGTFNVSVINERGKAIPVFSVIDEFTASSFYLLCGKNVYKLIGGLDKASGAEKTENGIRLRYYIKKVADILIDFTIFKSNPDVDADMVKITATVKSLSKRSSVYGLKLLLDTTLGEKTKYHFFNSDNLPIKSEVMYRTVQKTKWILSKNEDAAVQILLQGADISPLDFVAVANYETLNTMNWEPNIQADKAFNTVRSYNNSAVEINFMPVTIAPDEENQFVFYLALAGENEPVRGADFIANAGMILDDEPSVTPAKNASIEKSVPEKNSEDKNNKPSVEFNYDKNAINISPEYVQRLLDRIAELEEDDSNVNREEILYLNKELDYVLSELRKR